MGFRSSRNALSGGIALLTIVASAGPAFAGVIVDFTINSSGAPVANNPSIGDASTVNLSAVGSYVVNTVLSDDQTGLAQGNSIALLFGSAQPVSFSLGNNNLSGGFTESFSTTASTSCGGVSNGSGCTLGNYSATFTNLFVSTSAAGNLSWVFSGTLTLPDEQTQPDFLSVSFTQSAPGNGINMSLSESSSEPPQINTPEPASMTVLGTGLVALGAARRRKRNSI